jgi:putative transposase
MPRRARISIANMPHHVTQRGNAGQFLLATDSEKNVYLNLLQKYLRLYSVALAGYCLMSNHVHLILIPSAADALAVALKQIHGRFASFWNATHCSSGHVWQGRFYSCPLDDAHLWIALRYVERNPVRAQLAHRPEQWKWSSAAVHCGTQIAPSWLAMDKFRHRWTVQAWTVMLRKSRVTLTCARFARILTRAGLLVRETSYGKSKWQHTARGQTERFRIAALHDDVGYVRGNVPSVPSSPQFYSPFVRHSRQI